MRSKCNKPIRKGGDAVLYHASPMRGLSLLDPRKKSGWSIGDTPRVFASPSPAVAVAFMIRPDMYFPGMYLYGSYDSQTWHMVVGDEEKFRKVEQKGGSMYVVSANSFRPAPEIGLDELGQYSEDPVRVLAEEKWTSALEAMVHHDLKVFFVAGGEFERFKHLPGEDQSALLQLAHPRRDGTFNIVW